MRALPHVPFHLPPHGDSIASLKRPAFAAPALARAIEPMTRANQPVLPRRRGARR